MNHIIDKGRGRLIIAEHPSSVYITTEIDGAGVALFIDDYDDLMKCVEVLWNTARRVRKQRKGVSPSGPGHPA